MRRWKWLLAALALATSAGCDCRGAGVISVTDAGRPYDRVAPAPGTVAGATVSRSANFKLIGAVSAPSGTSSRSQNFQLRGGVVEANQE